jgi:hypothetical protein
MIAQEQGNHHGLSQRIDSWRNLILRLPAKKEKERRGREREK